MTSPETPIVGNTNSVAESQEGTFFPPVRQGARARWGRMWRHYRKNHAAVLGLFLVSIFTILALIGPYLAPYGPQAVRTGPTFSVPSKQNLLGTDDLGRDVLTGILFGIRTSMLVGFLAAATSAIIGIIVGSISGYFGGVLDDILMRITEFFLIIPTLFLAVVIVAIFGPNLRNIVIVIGLLSWPQIARVIRAQMLALKQREFAEAARSLGMSHMRIIFEELLPNGLPPVLVNVSLQIAAAILLEAGLSFLGLGDRNLRSLGLMLNDALPLFRTAWWTALFPGLAISLITLGFNLFGDGLNDVLNPRLRS